MALSVSDTRTIFTANDAVGGWDEGTTSYYLGADFGGREGTGFVGYDVDVETLHNFEVGITIPVDISGNHYGGWLRITNGGNLDTKALGGIRLCLRDGSGNESYWFVGGSDTYAGGWSYFVCDLDSTPNANNGTNAVVTNALDLGVGGKLLAKSADDNFQMDLMHYGTGGLVVTGTPDTGTYGTDNAMQELFDVIDTGNYGLLDKQAGVFVGKGPIQFNDDATGACTFNDVSSMWVWADLPVSDSYYTFSLGSSTGITSIRLGIVVGTGDNRQGVSGGAIVTVGVPWSLDFKTNLSANASNNIELYGCNFSGAKGGLLFDDLSKTSIVSFAAVNCGEIDLGTTGNGAEMLGGAIIDPEGLTNNYGLKFSQVPSGGILSHNTKKISFITSGVPTTQYMLHFPYVGDYTITLDAFKFFGDYSSVTLWHGLNDGTNADITISPTNGTDALQTEFSSTAGGTVTVTAVSVPITVTVKDATTGLPIELAHVRLLLNSDKVTVVLNLATNSSGVATTSRAYTVDEDIIGWVRQMDVLGIDYVQQDVSGTIESTGFSLTVNLLQI